VLSTSALSVTFGRYSSSDGSFRLTSKAATSPCLSSRNSVNSRAISVLPTSGRGEQMMKTGVVRIGAFSSEVDTGSRQENASNQESRAPFRFHRNRKGSSAFPPRAASGERHQTQTDSEKGPAA